MLEGEISQINLVERLVELWRERFTGALRFENDSIIKIIYFRTGDILSASTNDRADSLDEILMRAGKVSREHVKQALARRKESETLGDALLNLGFITRKELTWSRRVQAVGVIRSIVGWTSGSFTIVADYLPKRDEGTQFSLPQILVELIVTEQDRQRFESLLDGGEAVFVPADDLNAVYQRLGLNDDADAIVTEIDGEKTAAEIAAASGRDSFNVYKLLYALETLGVLSRLAPTPAVPPLPSDQFTLDEIDAPTMGEEAGTSDLWNDPAPEAGAAFEFDEEEAHRQPTLEVSMASMAPAPQPEAQEHSAWDEPDPEEYAPMTFDEPETVEAELPAWDVPARETAADPLQASMEPPAEREEEQWGFDDAQLETAQRGTGLSGSAVDVSAPPPTESRRYGLIIGLMVLFILAGAAYFGYQWWVDRDHQPLVAVTPTGQDTTPPADGPGVVEEGQSTVAPEDLTMAEPPPVRAPSVASPEPAAPPSLAPAASADANRARLDAAAREYAANPSGNYTVQIQILCDADNLAGAIRTGGGEVWFVPQLLGERPCYRVFWGRFTTEAEAQRALAAIPAGLRDRSSAVRSVPRSQ